MMSSSSTYVQYGTCSAALVIGHHSDIGAVATSLRKCANIPQAVPASMSTVAADADVLTRRDQYCAAVVATTSTPSTQSAWVYGLGVPSVSTDEPNSAGRWSISIRTDHASIDHPNFGSGGVPRNLAIAPRTTRAVAMAHGSSIKARGTKLSPCHGIVRSTITTARIKASETPRPETSRASHLNSPPWCLGGSRYLARFPKLIVWAHSISRTPNRVID